MFFSYSDFYYNFYIFEGHFWTQSHCCICSGYLKAPEKYFRRKVSSPEWLKSLWNLYDCFGYGVPTQVQLLYVEISLFYRESKCMSMNSSGYLSQLSYYSLLFDVLSSLWKNTGIIKFFWFGCWRLFIGQLHIWVMNDSSSKWIIQSLNLILHMSPFPITIFRNGYITQLYYLKGRPCSIWIDNDEEVMITGLNKYFFFVLFFIHYKLFLMNLEISRKNNKEILFTWLNYLKKKIGRLSCICL